MGLKLNEAFTDYAHFRDSAGTDITGGTVVCTVYDESENASTPAVTEVAKGLYKASFTPDIAGTWKTHFSCTKAGTTYPAIAHEFSAGKGQEADILTDTAEIQAELADGGRTDLLIDELTTQGDTNETKLDTISGYADKIDDAGDGLTAIKAEVEGIGGITPSQASDVTTAHTTTDGKIDALNNISTADVNTEVDNALDTAIPGVPTADSINERVATMDGNLDQAISTTESNIRGADSDDLKNISDEIAALSFAPASEYDVEMARITADVATEAKQDVIDGYHDVPVQNSAANSQVRDVIGNKTDTTAGDSVIGILKQILADTTNLPADPADDSDIDAQLATIVDDTDLIDDGTNGLAAIKAEVEGIGGITPAQASDVTTAHTTTDGKIDTIDGIVDNILIDTGTDIVADFDRHIVTYDFWSDSSATVTITGGSTDVNLPDVTIPTLPTGATLWKVVVLFQSSKAVDDSGSDNAINGAATIQIKDSGGSWGVDDITAYDVQDNSWAIDVSESIAIPGPVFIGNCNNNNLTSEVTGAGTYNLRFEDIQADGGNLYIHDAQVGLRVSWY